MTDKNGRRDLRPPQSIETEQMVLGAILKDPAAIDEVGNIIDNETAFYVPKHRTIARVLFGLSAKGQPCDITVAAAELQNSDQLEAIGGRAYLVELVEQTVTTANIAAHSQIVMDKARLRRLIGVCNNVLGSCYSQDQPAINILNESQQAIFEACETKARTGPVKLSRVLPDVLERIDKYQKGDKIEGQIDTGISKLDWLLKGEIRPGNSILLAGRPSHGKTQLALQIAEHATLQQGATVLLFSLEMIASKVGMRMTADQSFTDSERMKAPGELLPSDWERITHAQAKLSVADLWIDDRSVLTPLEILSTARSHASQHNLGLIIVDYLQLVDAGADRDKRHLEVAAISRHMKTMSKQLAVPVLTLSALNRGEENQEPTLSRLRDSGALEYDADVVLFVWQSKTGSSIIVGKNKEGQRGRVAMLFEEGKWKELEHSSRREEPPPEQEPFL